MGNSTIYLAQSASDPAGGGSATYPSDATFTSVTVNGVSQSLTTDIVKPDQAQLVVAPAAASEGIFFGKFGQVAYTGAGNLINGGHICGAIGWGALVSNATLAMGIGVEGRYDHNQGSTGTTTDAKALLGLARNSGGTMTNAKLYAGELQVAAGASVGTGYGAHVSVTLNGGAINKFVGFAMPNMQGVIPGITTKRFFENLDTAAPATSLSPIIDQAYGYAQPTTGFVYQMPPNISDFQFIPAGTLAAGTLVLPAPADAVDGQEICVGTTQTITSFTVNGNGATVYNAPTTLAAGATARFKFLGRGVNIWIRR